MIPLSAMNRLKSLSGKQRGTLSSPSEREEKMTIKVLPSYTQEHVAIAFVLGIGVGMFILKVVVPIAGMVAGALL